MAPPYDAIVIGSGFGGGVAACRLADAGWRVCVLERGRRFSGADFPERPEEAPRLIWHPRAHPHGMYDVRLMRDVVVITAAGVGGGSLVYANVQLRAPKDVFEEGWPEGVTRAVLDPYYDRTEEALDPRETPEQPALPKVRAFDALGRRAGMPAKRLPIAVHFGADRRHPFSGVEQRGCQNLARCDIGCPINSKNTVDLTYLARAEQQGAQVRPLHEAVRLDPPQTRGELWRVGYRHLGERRGGHLEAPVVLLAAGALGSTRLLLRNHKRLRGLSRAIGTRFSGNGDALGAAFDPRAADVTGGRHDYGPVMTSGLDYTEERRLILADGGLPTGWSGVLEVLRGTSLLTGWRRLLVRLRNAVARVGLSDQPLRPREVGSLEPSPITDTIVFLMFGRDAGDGRMRLTRLLRRFDIRWSPEGSRKLFEDLCRTAHEVGAAAEAKPFYALDAGPLGKFTTVHPLGGCPMADSPEDGVVDEFGRVYGYDGLLVTDGAVVPTALGVNPSKTIAALAERIVENLIRDRSP